MSTVMQDCQTTAWHQIQDSTGKHKAAIITPGNPLTCSWEPQERPHGERWDNLYVYQKGTNGSQDSRFEVDHGVRFDTARDLANCYAYEFEVQQVKTGWLYNGGWHARFDSGYWWAYSFSQHRWVSSPITIKPGDFDPSKPTRITAQYERVAGGLKYLTLTVNGLCSPVDYTDIAVPESGGYLSYAWQLDSRGRGAPINVEISGFNVSTFSD